MKLTHVIYSDNKNKPFQSSNEWNENTEQIQEIYHAINIPFKKYSHLYTSSEIDDNILEYNYVTSIEHYKS